MFLLTPWLTQVANFSTSAYAALVGDDNRALHTILLSEEKFVVGGWMGGEEGDSQGEE